MPVRDLHRGSKINSPGVAHKKALRITRYSGHMPSHGVIAVKGFTSSGSIKSLRFRIVSPAQQSKERNKAYHFFSID